MGFVLGYLVGFFQIFDVESLIFYDFDMEKANEFFVQNVVWVTKKVYFSLRKFQGLIFLPLSKRKFLRKLLKLLTKGRKMEQVKAMAPSWMNNRYIPK